MASVKRFKNSKIWYACYRRADGVRVQRSTATEDRDEALSIALAYERTSKSARRARFTQDSANRFLAEIAAITGLTLSIAEPVEDYLNRWLKVVRLSVGNRTGENYAFAVRAFLSFLGPRAKAPLAEVSPAVILAYRDHQAAAGKAPGTVNNLIGALTMAFAEAVKAGAFTRNPTEGIIMKGEAKAREKRKAFTFDQFKALVAATEGEWRTFILVCGLTGARRGEAQGLTWEQVDLDGGRILLNRSKTKDEHAMPLHPMLAEHLRSLPRGTGPIMPSLKAVSYGAVLSNYFRAHILPKVGLKQKFGERDGAGRSIAPYSIHSLRHSLATWLAQAGVEERMRMLLIGHEDKKVSRGYTHSQFADLAAALARVAGTQKPDSEL